MLNRVQSARSGSWMVALLVGFIALAVYGVSPVVTAGDSFLVAPTTASIVQSGDLDINEFAGAGTGVGIGYVLNEDSGDGARTFGAIDPNLGPSERLFDFFPWTTALVIAPLFLLLRIPGQLFEQEFFDPDRMVAEGDSGLINLMGGSSLTAAGVVLLTLIAMEFLDLPRRTRVLASFSVGLTAAFATSAWSTLSRALWSQSTAFFFASLALFVLVKNVSDDDPLPRTAAIFIGVFSGLAYTARPTAAVLIVVVFLWLAVHRREAIGYFIVGGGFVALPWAAVNLATWGKLQPPYFEPGRAEPSDFLATGLVGNLISPNRGLLVFSPVVILALIGLLIALRSRSSERKTLVLVMGLGTVLHWVIVSGGGEAWHAGHSYGPRFMADTIPYLVIAALPAVEQIAAVDVRPPRVAAAFLVVLSVFLHAPGALSKQSSCWNAGPVDIDTDPSRAQDWGDLQFLAGVQVFLDTGSLSEATVGECSFG